VKLVLGQDAAVAAWVARKLGYDDAEFFGPCVAMAVADSDDQPLAGVVFSGYRDIYKSIEISIAAESPRWATRGIIHALLSYPFDQLGCERVHVTIPLRNKRAQRFCKGIGFVQEGVMRRGFGLDHAVVMSMLRHEFARLFKRKQRNV
jgi:RimJ/RimL family protein N-acetyltransferase